MVALIVGHDIGEGIVADDYMIGTAPDKNSPVGAKVVGAVGHILKGVVGKGQVGDRLAKRLSSIAALSIGLNAAAMGDAFSRGRAPDGGVRLDICEDVGATVGPGDGGYRLAFNPDAAGGEIHRRRQVIGSRRRKEDCVSLGHRRDATLDRWIVVGFAIAGRAPICFCIPRARGGG